MAKDIGGEASANFVDVQSHPLDAGVGCRKLVHFHFVLQDMRFDGLTLTQELGSIANVVLHCCYAGPILVLIGQHD